jgi:hypothetical protein
MAAPKNVGATTFCTFFNIWAVPLQRLRLKTEPAPFSKPVKPR